MNGLTKKIIQSVGIFLFFAFLSSCAIQRGVYHEVRKGQTLWRISQAYGVDLDLIMRVNDIENARQVQVGRQILIPGVDRTRRVSTSSRQTSTTSPPNSGSSSEPIPPGGSSQSQETSEGSNQSPQQTQNKTADGAEDIIGSESFQPTWPCQGRIVSRFDKDGDPTRQGVMMHVAPESPVSAMESGVVRLAKEVDDPPELKQLGKLVMIFHSDNFVSVYAHLDKIAVEKGDDVNRGEQIGRAGSTGYVDQDSCYFQIRYKVQPRDPLLFLGDPS